MVTPFVKNTKTQSTENKRKRSRQKSSTATPLHVRDHNTTMYAEIICIYNWRPPNLCKLASIISFQDRPYSPKTCTELEPPLQISENLAPNRSAYLYSHRPPKLEWGRRSNRPWASSIILICLPRPTRPVCIFAHNAHMHI